MTTGRDRTITNKQTRLLVREAAPWRLTPKWFDNILTSGHESHKGFDAKTDGLTDSSSDVKWLGLWLPDGWWRILPRVWGGRGVVLASPHPRGAGVKSAWSYTSIPPNVFMVWCLVKHRDSFTFTFTLRGKLDPYFKPPSVPRTDVLQGVIPWSLEESCVCDYFQQFRPYITKWQNLTWLTACKSYVCNNQGKCSKMLKKLC
jgi:hypothetical protein